jgi:hypothetical protein
MSGANRTKVSVHFFVYVCGLLWAQLCMYAGCCGHSRVCTRVVVGTVAYVRGLQWAQSRMYAGCCRHSFIYMDCSEVRSRMYAGCSKVNHVHLYKFF